MYECTSRYFNGCEAVTSHDKMKATSPRVEDYIFCVVPGSFNGGLSGAAQQSFGCNAAKCM